MKRYAYDADGMKNAAGKIAEQLASFQKARAAAERIINEIGTSWDDETNRRFQSRFRTDAQPAMQNAEKSMEQTAKLLRQASRIYGGAIDNGSGQLNAD